MPEARSGEEDAARRPGKRRLRRADFAMGPVELARSLIGRRLVRVLRDGTRLAGIVVETEAYLGVPDKGAHSFGGRRTARTEPMFGPPGTAYVYFTYGMHHCMNVAAGEEGDPVAVLIRALEPTEGLGQMEANRGGTLGRRMKATDLCSGPGKLCQALGIDRSFSGVNLVSSGEIFFEHGAGPAALGSLVNTPRIGLGAGPRGAAEWAGAPLRWHLAGNPHVSR
jgi:DNA-3-methyladenine glycosylase